MTIKAALLILLFSMSAGAAELSETFSTRDNYASGTAIWNQALGKVHPSLQVEDYDDGSTGNTVPPAPLAVDVGDGSHGVFNITTYANFSVGGNLAGNVIRLDTSVYPILKVTSFHLEDGWFLEPVGSNPLIIYSLSDIRIEGEIWCHGEVGGTPLGSVPGAGGIGRCGGARGGDGGSGGGTPAAGSNGQSPNGAITGGGGGTGTAGMSAGGGGSWDAHGGFIATAGSTGGGAGTSSNDAMFTNYYGGAGGGGGAGFNGGGGGAGGGGGGGTVILHAVGDINIGEAPASSNGLIKAYGGDGGSSSSNGGAGGGGGGGGVLAFSGGTINLYNNVAANASDAGRGTGGTNASAATGGLGGSGRSWFMAPSPANYNFVGFYQPAEQTPIDTTNGKVLFNAASQNVISRVFEIQSNFATFNSVTATPSSGDFVIAIAGSDDNFGNDDTGFTTDFSLLTNKRSFKFRVTVTTSNAVSPTMLDALTISYTPGLREKFEMKAAGCGRIDAGGGGPNGVFMLLPCMIALVVILAMRFRPLAKHFPTRF